MSGTAPGDPSSISSSGYSDGLGRRVLEIDHETGEMRERLVLRPELGVFEQVLRDRVARAASMNDERFARPMSVQHDQEQRLTVLSEYVAGRRLADAIDTAASAGVAAGLDAAIGLMLELLPAIGYLHGVAGYAHGCLGTGRLVLTPTGQLIILDWIYGAALEKLQFTRQRLWTEFDVAAPPTAGSARLDISADLTQAGMVGAALIIGRPLGERDYPKGIPALRAEILEVAQIRGTAAFAAGFEKFFDRLLPLPARRSYPSADEAVLELRQIVRREIGIDTCRSALLDFLHQLDAAETDRAALPTADAARVDAVRAEAQREQAARAEDERQERDRAEAARVEAERLEAERREKERLLAEHRERERLEADRLEAERREQARLDAERRERERLDAERLEAKRREKERLEAERRERERLEAERLEAERRQRLEAERREQERLDAERRERERLEAERREKERLEAERRERERLQAERVQAEREEHARLEAERLERERLEAERAAEAAHEPEQPDEIAASASSRRKKRDRSARAKKDRLRSLEAAKSPAAPPPPAPAAVPAAPTPAQPAPAQRSWLVPPERAAAFEPPVPETHAEPPRPVPVQRSYPVYVPPADAGWVPPPPVATPEPSRVAVTGAPIRLKSDAGAFREGSSRAVEPPSLAPIALKTETRRPAPPRDLSSIYTPHEDTAEPPRRQVPWKMIAAAAVVIFAGLAAFSAWHSPATSTQSAAAVAAAAKPQPTAPAAVVSVGAITVKTDPAGARVLLDGKAAGESPVTMDAVTPGRHTITVVAEAGAVRRTVRVEAGATATLEIPIFSGFAAISAPIVLDVTEGNRALGTSENQIILTPGKHELRLANRALNYATTQTVEIEPGEVQRVQIDPKGTANINAQPWAEVWIDGTKVGETPLANLPITLGVRDIVFRNPQLGERKVTVTIVAGAPTTVTMDFTKQ